MKENQFFNQPNEYKKGGSDYAASFKKCGSDILTIDATPNYLTFDTGVNAKRIYDSYTDEDLKRKKIIILYLNTKTILLHFINS